jgi:Na+-translocating ferredoxin:NAD+ oxidoreductase RnfG subunit
MPTGILTAILSAVSGIFAAINNVFGAKNTKEMKERQEAQKEVDHQSEIEKAVKEKDLEEVRKHISS